MAINTKSVDNEILSTVRPWLITLALVFLFNPVVRVVDVLPDFIACAILIKALGYAADRAPFFEEAKNGLFRLAAISLAKIPAFMIISLARNGNTLDNDTSVLFTFVFSVIETVVLFVFFPEKVQRSLKKNLSLFTTNSIISFWKLKI